MVTVLSGEKAHSLAKRLVREAGADVYDGAGDSDDIQDPYRAVDECDAVVWLNSSYGTLSDMTEYNSLYADTVMRRALRLGKPVLYYHFPKQLDPHTLPPLLDCATRCREVRDLQEFSDCLRSDLRDLVTEKTPGPNRPSSSAKR